MMRCNAIVKKGKREKLPVLLVGIELCFPSVHNPG